MKFLDREEELARLQALARTREGGLAVLFGRRRLGKTRLLLEWSRRDDGLYTVADLSSPQLQRHYLAQTLASRFPALQDFDFRDWGGLFSALAREAGRASWRGPFILDEFPYLVQNSPELPSILQRWIDHEARRLGLVTVISGSSQSLMQGLVLRREAPLFGRAKVMLEIAPLEPRFLRGAFPRARDPELVELHAAWGGTPRYWELAVEEGGALRENIERLVLDPMGPLHREPESILLEETPSALEVRPLLDAIGAGCHRPSEMAARIGRPVTSLSRPLARLQELRLVHREVPFGELEKSGRKALYRLADPFFSLWFRVVAPHRGALLAGSKASRLKLLDRHWPGLRSLAWEELCRHLVPRIHPGSPLSSPGGWGPAQRWWSGNSPEWDVVSSSLEGDRLLLGEAKWPEAGLDRAELERRIRELSSRPAPLLPPRYDRLESIRVLFVPEKPRGYRDRRDGPWVVTAKDLLG